MGVGVDVGVAVGVAVGVGVGVSVGVGVAVGVGVTLGVGVGSGGWIASCPRVSYGSQPFPMYMLGNDAGSSQSYVGGY